MTTEINTIRVATQQECLEMIVQSLLQGGIRTANGFEVVSVHATHGIRYSIRLPYDDLTTHGLVYAKADQLYWHSISQCTLPFTRSLAILVAREQYSRRCNMNTDANLPPKYVEYMEYLAAGYDKTEAATLSGLSRTQMETATDKLLDTWQARSLSWLIAKYILTQHAPTSTSNKYNPYNSEIS